MNGAMHRSVAAIKPAGVISRGMATEKQILMRITSTRNISKITKSMKMVSAAKLRGAETRLKNGRSFAHFLDEVYGKPTDFSVTGPLAKEALPSNLVVAVTSDRGLCGGVNTYVSKATRATIEGLKAEGKQVELMIMGEKGRSQLRRTNASDTTLNILDLWKVPTNFAQASALAEVILSATKADQIHIIFNVFKSAIAQIPSTRRIATPGAGAKAAGPEGEPVKDALAERFLTYEIEPDSREEVLQDFYEYSLASGIFGAMLESNTSEESSRMSAMENATKNAQELVQSLTLVYNKARQARITTELIEIISGATSLEG